MDAQDPLKLLLFGKGIDRFRVFTRLYIAMLSVCITSYIARKYYDLVFIGFKENNYLNDVLRCLQDPYTYIVIVVFLVVLFLVHSTGKIVFDIILDTPLRKMMYIPLEIILVLYGLIVGLFTCRLKTFFANFKFIIKSVNSKIFFEAFINRIFLKNVSGKMKKTKLYPMFKSYVKDINNDGYIYENTHNILSMFFGTYLVFYLNDIDLLSPWLYHVIKWIFVYWVCNTFYWSFIISKKDYLLQKMIETDEYEKIDN